MKNNALHRKEDIKEIIHEATPSAPSEPVDAPDRKAASKQIYSYLDDIFENQTTHIEGKRECIA